MSSSVPKAIVNELKNRIRLLSAHNDELQRAIEAKDKAIQRAEKERDEAQEQASDLAEVLSVMEAAQDLECDSAPPRPCGECPQCGAAAALSKYITATEPKTTHASKPK